MFISGSWATSKVHIFREMRNFQRYISQTRGVHEAQMMPRAREEETIVVKNIFKIIV